ncbi:MAG: restriction endonuclease [Akkermansiaceae bacterium]|nr:restriction endonuclease [Akkermansiaceae bacterium]MCF7733686.1 restriction endonuclease [Akkermansiaceae bacterium]
MDRPFVGDGPTWLGIKYAKHKETCLLFQNVVKLLGSHHFDKGNVQLGKGFDSKVFFDLVKVSLPEGFLDLAIELIEYIESGERASPWEWCEARLVDWRDTAELCDFFKSESLKCLHGTFFDQRFANYLSRNFEKIGEMNWRKFEGLTAEYFLREGFEVEVGPGRNDGGIDVRVWKPGTLALSPPLIIIQCKRQRHKIEKAVVKSLWADLVDLNAGAGLIVTISSLSPGAETVRLSRSYPIEVANNGHLKNWLERLRTPGTGIYLGS